MTVLIDYLNQSRFGTWVTNKEQIVYIFSIAYFQAFIGINFGSAFQLLFLLIERKSIGS